MEARDDHEARLVSIWQDLLGYETIGVHDNFFKMGGDSLLAIQLSTRLREIYQVEITVNNLFDEPTIAMLAAKIRDLCAARQDERDVLEDKLAMIENMSPEEVSRMLAQLKKEKEGNP